MRGIINKWRYDSSGPLLSIHILKCGGTSLREVLTHWFGDKLYLHYYREKEGRAPIRYVLGAGDCVHGHFSHPRGFGVDDYYPAITQRITIVRDPLEMAVSRYFFKKQRIADNMNYIAGKLQSPSMPPLSEALLNGRNFMLDFLPKGLNKGNMKLILDDYFIFVGVMERYTETIRKLGTLLGKENCEVPHLIQTPRSEEVSPDIERKFRQRFELSYRIYDYAVDRLDRF